MTLGLCCHFLEQHGSSYQNSINEKSMQLGRFRAGAYSQSHIHNLYINNLQEIIRLLPKLISNNIKCFRISSSTFPLFEFNKSLIESSKDIRDLLNRAGRGYLGAGIRVTTHPGQFTVLSSDKPPTVTAAITELDFHGWVFDAMEFPQTPEYAINVHGGKSDRHQQLVAGISRLSAGARKRLTLENDESSYSVRQLLAVSEETDVPVCFDSHHHTFNEDGLSLEDAYGLSVLTWKRRGCKPLQHISNSTPNLPQSSSFQDKRKHSDFIHHVPECQLVGLLKDEVDVEVEAKMKNLALLKMREMLLKHSDV